MNSHNIMNSRENPDHDCVHEKDRKVTKHFNRISEERLVKRSIKLSNSESQSLANCKSSFDNNESFDEIAECTNTSKSYIKQNTTIQKSEHDQDFNLQNSELDDTAVQEISPREHFESLDMSQVSDFWDQETYLSEHNYDETLDTETAKTILNFAEVQSPRFMELEKRKKISRSKLENERSQLRDDSNSEDDCTDVFMVISDLKKDIAKYEEEYKIQRSKGFENIENPRRTKCVLEKCEGSLQFLRSLNRETASNNNFLARKNGREIRFLQNRWKVLEKLARQDEKLKSVYLTIKQDIQALEEELSEHQTKVKGYERKSVKDLRKYLRFYKDSNIKLTGLKSRLFEVNLGVHTLLADISCNTEDKVKYLEVDRMKDDVVELYERWDECIKLVASKLSTAEESVKSITKIEKDILELSDFLKKETKLSVEKMKLSGKIVDDSGISDGSGDMLQKRKT